MTEPKRYAVDEFVQCVIEKKNAIMITGIQKGNKLYMLEKEKSTKILIKIDECLTWCPQEIMTLIKTYLFSTICVVHTEKRINSMICICIDNKYFNIDECNDGKFIDFNFYCDSELLGSKDSLCFVEDLSGKIINVGDKTELLFEKK